MDRLFVEAELRGQGGGGEGCTPHNGLYREDTPGRGLLYRLEVYKRVGISSVEV